MIKWKRAPIIVNGSYELGKLISKSWWSHQDQTYIDDQFQVNRLLRIVNSMIIGD